MSLTQQQIESGLSLSFFDRAWIQTFPLNEFTVIDYFSNSPFYDRTCNNQVVKMQQLDPSQLLNMTGIEYAVVYKREPELYIIQQQRRTSPSSVSPMAQFYVVNGSIYQAPDLFHLINSRLTSSIYKLTQAFKEAASYTRFSPAVGYTWDFDKDDKPAAAEDRGTAAMNSFANTPM